jgi:beta-lactam-binding protein with PASTA domain
MGNRSDTVRLLEVGLLAWAILAIAQVGQAQDAAAPITTARVPSVLGLPASKARTVLEKSGLTTRFSLGDPPARAEQALVSYAQQPSAGATVAAGSLVTVTIYSRVAPPKVPAKEASSNSSTASLPAIAVPDLVGKSPVDAKAAVAALGLVAQEVEKALSHCRIWICGSGTVT